MCELSRIRDDKASISWLDRRIADTKRRYLEIHLRLVGYVKSDFRVRPCSRWTVSRLLQQSPAAPPGRRESSQTTTTWEPHVAIRACPSTQKGMESVGQIWPQNTRRLDHSSLPRRVSRHLPVGSTTENLYCVAQKAISIDNDGYSRGNVRNLFGVH
jgi:hypothetical protein